MTPGPARPPGGLSLLADARRLPLADGSVHLVITSPPYNARINYDGYEDWLPWEDYWHGLIEPAMRECFRVLAHGGRIAVNIANMARTPTPQPGHYGRATQYQGRNGRERSAIGAQDLSWPILIIPRLWALLENVGFLPREHLTWIKGEDPEDIPARSTAWGSWRSASNPVLRATSEPVLIASKGDRTREPGESDLTADEFKAWTRNAWFITTGHADQYLGHPAKFPVELPRRLIKLYSYVGDVVCDPFGGSGSTGVAAAMTGRRYVGADISPSYPRMARDRIRHGTRAAKQMRNGQVLLDLREPQPSLFAEAAP